MQFKDIVGQQELKERLIRGAAEGRISHAQLFLGEPGSGTIPLAIAYAQYLNCSNRGANDSCGVCPSCHKMQKLMHPDIHFTFPTNKTAEIGDRVIVSDLFLDYWRSIVSNLTYFDEQDWYSHIELGNKQGIIGVAEADNIIKKLSYKSFEGEYKVLIMWLPERMNTSAANALLKLVEEPPAKTIFILIAQEEGKVLKTILSRTQIIRVPRIRHEDLLQSLSAKYSTSNMPIENVARLASGSMIEARRLLEVDEESNDFFNYVITMLRLCYQSNVIGLIEWSEEVATLGRDRIKRLLAYAERVIREAFMLNLRMEAVSYLPLDRAQQDFYAKFKPFIRPNNVEETFTLLNTAIHHVNANANPKIVLTDMTLKMVKLIKP
jgi:DNA polymerase-3 subunit delta'